MKESVLSISKFNTPLLLEEHNAISTMIIRLLLLNPGTIQSHPEMGVGLVTKWRFCDIEDLSKLQDEVYSQISTYLPLFLLNEVNIKYQKKLLIIEIHIDSNIYIFGTEEFNNVSLIDILSA